MADGFGQKIPGTPLAVRVHVHVVQVDLLAKAILLANGRRRRHDARPGGPRRELDRCEKSSRRWYAGESPCYFKSISAHGRSQDSLLIKGVAFKKTFSYAGFEQQPKSFTNPKILCLNVELELKAEKDNAEVRVNEVSEYQAIVDAEWQIIYRKLEAIVATGAKVVLSRLPIGDLATQYFADRDIFCAGRVAHDDLKRVVQAVGGSIQSTCSDIEEKHLGACGKFEERQIGGERFNIFEDCKSAKTCTLLLRGGAEQFIAEVERSLHDAIMIVKRAIKNNTIVAGGGAAEVSSPLSRF